MIASRLLLALLLSLFALPLAAEEVIERFHSDIEVRANGDLVVTETIRARAEGRAIRRGIFRDFPTRYRDARGRDLVVGFELLSVMRDGRDEPYHVTGVSNGKRVYIGDSNVYLDPGVYEYRLSYRTTRQLGFFDDFDELYWNVTGTGWAFPILQASARVRLPAEADELQLTGYTGAQGSTRQDLDYRRRDDGSAWFETRAPLGRNEGLTIVVGWPKGIVAEPGDAQRRAWFWQDNRTTIIVLAGAAALLVYYLLLWRMVGRDPEAGVILPRYRPPEGYSPASMRYVENMGYDKTCFTAAVINLGVKDALVIDEDDDDFSVTRGGPPAAPLAAGEKQVLDGLFGDGRDRVEIEQSNHSLLSSAISAHKRSLKRDYAKKYFNTNAWLLLPGIIFTVVLGFAAVASLGSEAQIARALVALFICVIALAMLNALVRGFTLRGKRRVIQVLSNLFALGIFAVAFVQIDFPFAAFFADLPLPMVGGIVVMLTINYLFYHWLKAPTLAGRRLLDQIEGFKHYLKVAEKDEIAVTDAPTFDSDLYESYLPYAIALGLENEWNARLDDAVEAGLVDRAYSRPRWYRSRNHGGRGFGSALAGSFDSAIASSSVAPGSSSGSSGGSSGGGGGGGGGGGW